MTLYLTRRGSRMTLIFLLLLAIAVPAMAETPTSDPTTNTTATPAASTNPTLIVWAHTDLPGQGAPTLDVVDLERYFVQQLTHCSIENVVPSATTKMPNTPASNLYLIEVVVDTMRPAKRSTWNETSHGYDDHDIFEVDLSLVVKHSQSGRVVGTTGERHEHWFTSSSESQRLVEKRAAIFKASDHLADRFVAELQTGRYGATLTPPPTPPTWWERALAWDRNAVGAIVTIGCIGLIGFIFMMAIISDVSNRKAEHQRVQAQAWNDHCMTAQWDKELQEALALKFETRNFSEAACLATAQEKRAEWLKGAAEIQAREAERQLKSKDLEAQYERVATYAVSKCDLTRNEITNMLHAAAIWPYRVLEKAIEITEGAPHGK